MSIREEDQPVSQTTGARNAGGDIQTKDPGIDDTGDEPKPAAGINSAERPAQQN